MNYLDVTPRGDNHLMLFVTGIPSKCSPHQIISHFSAFGRVKIHRLASAKKGGRLLQANPIANTRRGFCVLQAMDRPSYEAVLNSEAVSFLGRTLAINRFRQGEELQAYNDYVNARRVVIKKVPSNTDPELFKSILEEIFGKISRIYRYEAESTQKAIKKVHRRRTHTYSVEFELIQTAEKAAETGILTLNDNASPVLIERYNRRSATNHFEPEFGSYPALREQRYEEFLIDPVPSYQTFNLQNHGIPAQNFNGDLGEVRGEVNKEVFILHALKPTAKGYHSRRLKSPESSMVHEERSHVRFNISIAIQESQGIPVSFRKRPTDPTARESQQQKRTSPSSAY